MTRLVNKMHRIMNKKRGSVKDLLRRNILVLLAFLATLVALFNILSVHFRKDSYSSFMGPAAYLRRSPVLSTCTVCGGAGEIPIKVRSQGSRCDMCPEGQYISYKEPNETGCALCPRAVPEEPCASAGDLTDWLVLKGGRNGVSRVNPVCPQAARNRIHVVIPFYNVDAETLEAAFRSVEKQNYPAEKAAIWLFDDASTRHAGFFGLCGGDSLVEFTPPANDGGDKADRQFASDTLEGVVAPGDMPLPLCLRSTSHLGPGGAKYWAFMFVDAMAQPNDLVVVLDGDDELHSMNALQIINNKYIDEGVWCTYGSFAGKYSSQTKPIPGAFKSGHESFLPRQEMPTSSWRYGHPRTFKAHLLRHMSRKDFTYSDGSWLLKATDRGYVYRMLELSGADRVGYIPERIYKYKYSNATSTLASVPPATREAHLQHVLDLAPSSRLDLTLHIVLVCWGRIFLLKDQLIFLQDQTGLFGRQLQIHLLNNNIEKKDEVEKMVQSFKRWQQSATLKPGVLPLSIVVVHNEVNWHAFSRFVYVDELRKREPLDYVVFVDDDQYWMPHFVSSLVDEHKPKGMTTWYGKKFEFRDSNGLADYWKSSISWIHILKSDKPSVSTFTYGGPGGSIIDGNLWLLDSQLLRLKTDLSMFHKYDDIWVSYIINGLLGWETRRLLTPVCIDVANVHRSIYAKNVLKLVEEKPLARLMEINAKVRDEIKGVATWESAKIDKTQMFQVMQMTFRWDVTHDARDKTRPWQLFS